MRNGIVVAIAFSAIPFFACSNDSTPNAADTESQKGSFVHVLQGKYVIDKICLSYTEVMVPDIVALFGTHGFLEIALNHGKAASLLGLSRDSSVDIIFK